MGTNRCPAVTLTLLTGFTLSIDGRDFPLIWSTQRLLAFLALKDRPLARSYVAETLWPETTTAKANANLRSALWRVQRSGGHPVDAGPQALVLSAHVFVDLREAQARAHELLDGDASCDELLTATTRSWLSAELLPDWYEDDWVLVEREHYNQLRLHALESLCYRLTSVGRHGEAVVAGLAAVRAEPLRESAHRAVVEAHLAAGNQWEAVRQYERCRQLLREQLGVEPTDALRRLVPTPVHRRSLGPHVRMIPGQGHATQAHLVADRGAT
jgi:DNA-binding SARP family transcriptional activator